MVMLRFLSGRALEKVDLGPFLFKRLRIQGKFAKRNYWCV
jgi:hypothetical protein